MSVKSDADEIGRKRKRDAALQAALTKLEGSPTIIKGAPEIPQPAVVEHASDLTLEERSAQLTAEALRGSAQSMPVTVLRTEKDWIRNGVQFRPQTSREREQEMNYRLDKQALKNYSAYCDLVQSDIDLGEAYEKQRQARMSREKRTGLRPLPSAKDRTISLAQAKAEGYICNGNDE